MRCPILACHSRVRPVAMRSAVLSWRMLLPCATRCAGTSGTDQASQVEKTSGKGRSLLQANSATALRACYAMSSTDRAYGATAGVRLGGGRVGSVRYLPTAALCPARAVLTQRMAAGSARTVPHFRSPTGKYLSTSLRTPYAMSGTDIEHGAIALRPYYAAMPYLPTCG
eukprot:1051489-Rhodomonas_salina.1